MEKIKDEKVLEFTPDEFISRLKTLEDKVKFIMKHSCFVADVGIDDETLQDLWDEENKMTEFKFNPPVEVKTGVEYEVKTCINCKEPTVKECDCEKRGDFCSCPITELYNDGEISLRKRTIISGKPTVKCMCGEQTTFGEADVEIGGVRHRVKHPCYVIPTDNSEKIEEIISGVRDKYAEGYFYGHTYFKMFESWLRDKLKGL